jgi:hypothetical protein
MYKFIQITQINSCCFSLIFLTSKCTIIKLNSLCDFTTNIWVYSDDLWILCTWITIKKTVEFFTVAMQVKNESNGALFI